MIFDILEKLIERKEINGHARVSVPEDLFRRMLAAAIKQKGLFDEKFYMESYADVSKAVTNGRVPSGLDHYVTAGYFENRLPKKLIVDEHFYLQENPDVAEAIKKGKLKTAQEHFDASGFREGRSPYKGFSIF
jgi:hypothetical protein